MTQASHACSLGGEFFLSSSRIPTVWLSDEMARALAVICPPLTAADVRQAAEKLAGSEKPSHVIDDFLKLGADLMIGRQVVEALGALRDVDSDAVAPDSTLGRPEGWITPGKRQMERDVAISDRLLLELVRVLSKSISADAMRGIVLRAMYLVEVDFPFLADLRASPEFDADFGDIHERLSSANSVEARDATSAILRKTLELLNGLIGDHLTSSLTRLA